MTNYLTVANLILEMAPDETLRAQVQGQRCGLRVDVLRAFPLSHPEENLVLRDGGGVELGVIAKMTDLDERAQMFLRAALDRRYFLPKITAIKSIFERFGFSIWEVETDRGPVSINTKAINDALSEITPDRFILRDTEENRFEIPQLSALDEASRARFQGKV